MSIRRAFLLFLGLASAPVALSREPDDPLPEGAVARLGSLRFWHGAQIGALALSPDGKIVASGGEFGRWIFKGGPLAEAEYDRRVCLWDAASGRKLREFRTSYGPIHSMDFSRDGKVLAAGCGQQVYLWDPATGKQLRRLEGYDSVLRCVRFLADNKTLAIEQEWGALRLCDPATGKRLRFLEPWKNKLLLLKDTAQATGLWKFGTLSPDGKLMAWRVCKEERIGQDVLALFEVATGKQLHEMEVRGSGCEASAFSPDGKLLATGFNKICLWDTATGKCLKELDGFPAAVNSLCFSPDGRTLVSSHDCRGLQVWDVQKGKQRYEIPLPSRSLEHNPRPIRFSPDGKTLLAAGATVRRWEAATGKEIPLGPGHREPLRQLHFSSDGKILTSWCGSAFSSWRTASWEEANRADLSLFTKDHSEPMAFSPDGKLLIRQTKKGSLQLRQAADDRLLRTFEGKEEELAGGSFTADGTMVYLGQLSLNEIHIVAYAVPTGKLVSRIRLSDARVVETDPRGKYMAVSSEAGDVRVLDTATSKLLWSSEARNSEGESKRRNGENVLAFSNDGRFLAHAVERERGGADVKKSDSIIRVWNVRTGRKITEIVVRPEPDSAIGITALAFSRDGRVLASGQKVDDSVRLWEIASGQQIGKLVGHQAAVQTLAFAPDGTLASGADDCTVLVWNIEAARRGNRPRPAGTKPEELQALWVRLVKIPAGPAANAMATLIETPLRSVPFLTEQLRPARAADPQIVASLIADLGSERFPVRQKATAALEELDEAAEPALREVLRSRPVLEVRRRVERLLDRLEGAVPLPERLREIRAIEVLERIGTRDAREFLSVLTKGTAEARLTREAQAALQRLDRLQ